MSKPKEQAVNLDLPDWYPSWARQIAELYFSGTSCFFILHGNVHDLVPCKDGTKTDFLSLTEFLGEYRSATQSQQRPAGTGGQRQRASSGDDA
jgi:hypothetical protein